MYPERDGRMGSFGDQDFARSLLEAFTDPARHARMMRASQAFFFASLPFGKQVLL